MPAKLDLLKRKVKLIRTLTAVEDEGMIDAVESTLAGSTHRSLSQDQMKQLDASIERYMSGEVRTYAPAQVRARALKAIRG